MNETETRFAYRVGIVVICAAVILAILILLFGEGWRSEYTLFVETPTAPNVTVNTPVRKNGIRIGRVADVENRDRSVLLTLKINSDETIYESEVCRIGTASLIGDAVLDFVPGNEPIRGNQLTDRALIEADQVAIERNPLEAIDVVLNLESKVGDTLDTFNRAGREVERAAANIADISDGVREAVGGEDADLREFFRNTRELSSKAEIAIDNFNEFMVNLNEITGDTEVRENLMVSIEKLPELLDEINTTVRDTRETINGFKEVSASAETNLANLHEFTRSLGSEGPELVRNLNNSLRKIDALVTDIGSFADGARGSGGTLGKLLNDPELYDNLNATVRNAREISEQLKPVIIQLQPLMNDIRYTVDGIARDPGQVLRGAFDNRPAYGKYKGTVIPPVQR